MNDRFRIIRSAACAVAAAALLSSCQDETGILDAFFGARGMGDCERLTVTIDLDDAGAVLGPAIEGEDDCSLSEILDDAGCTIDADPIDSGRLRVIVAGCRIDDRAPLFRCGFADGELVAIADHTTAVCDCFAGSCDVTPPICVGGDPDLDDCEDCDNGIDDDGNGEEDCEDAACEDSGDCNLLTTTTSSSTTFVTEPSSTSTTSSTTTTLTSPAQRYTVKFGLDNGTGIGAIQFDIGYAAIASASLRTRAVLSDPECRKLVPTALAGFQNDEEEQAVHVTMSNLPGTSGPIELVECTFAVASEPTSGDFDVDVIQALDLEGDPIGNPPPVEVGDIAPAPTTTTTQEPSSTTTLDVTTTTIDGVTTTTLQGAEVYLVTFRLESASANVGALQWSTSYGAATGGFEGKGSQVECNELVDNTLFAPNDKDLVCSLDHAKVCTTNSDCSTGSKGTCTVELEALVLGLISLDSFPAPTDLVTCAFNGSVDDPPAPGDFVVTIEDATDAEGAEISASLSVKITVP